MNEKIEVGKRFSKREISIEEHLKIFVGLAKPIDRKIIREFFETFKNEDEIFSALLKDFKVFFRVQMQSWGLPCVPYLYQVNGALTRWQENKPEGWREEDNELYKVSLDQYILHRGYEHDSLQHLAAEALCLIYRIDKAMNVKALHLTVLPFMMFELGRIHTLFSVYDLESKDGRKGPKIRREVNPFNAYGKMLAKKYPDKSYSQIFKMIPRGYLDENSRPEPKNNNSPDICCGWDFFKVNDDGVLKIAAIRDEDGKYRMIKAESFRKTYLIGL